MGRAGAVLTGQVFISYTSDMAVFPEGRPFVRAALDGVVRAGMAPVGMGYFAARDGQPADYCRERVRECEFYVAVIGLRYGSIVPGETISYTELEFTEAGVAGLVRLVFLLDENALAPADTDRDAVDGFRERLRRAGLITGGFRTADGLELAVYQALTERVLRGAARAESDTVRRGFHFGGQNAQVVPRQLGPAPRRFAGREPELGVLTAMLNDTADTGATVVISAIGGSGGIGKTWLALHWAHEQIDRFPDGQLFVDLRGFAPTGDPMSTAETVRGFLHALGENPNGLPVDLDAQVGLYRSLVADRRMLIVLDNARETSQVAPLLPGSRSCTVLVTSRRHLAGLVTVHGARSVDLAVLADTESRQLLAGHLGADRVAAEPDAVAELLEYCAGLPLALSIVAARATVHLDFPLAALAEELHDQRTRLDGLNAGEIPLNLRTVFSSSYNALPDDAARLFGLLGLAPGPDISLQAAAALAGLPVSEMRAILRELETAHLVSQPALDRYRFHDLLRLYATEQAERRQSMEIRQDALRRLMDFYLYTAHNAERLLDRHRHPIEIGVAESDCHPISFRDQTAAEAWLEAEHSGLLAGQQLATEMRWDTVGWQLAWSLDTFHYRRGHLHEWRWTWENGLTCARRRGDPAVISLAHRLLGDAHLNLGNHAEALDQLREALTTAEDAGDLLAQAHAHRILTWAYGRQSDYRHALEHAVSALHLYRSLGLQVREAAMLNATGWFTAQLGDFEHARTQCEEALRLCRRHQYRVGEANTLVSLGYVAQHTDRLKEALGFYQDALALFRDLNSMYYQADTLDRIGQIHAVAGRPSQARGAWLQAVHIYREKYRPADADRVEQELRSLIDVG